MGWKKNIANELLFLFVFLRRVSTEVFKWNRLYL